MERTGLRDSDLPMSAFKGLAIFLDMLLIERRKSILIPVHSTPTSEQLQFRSVRLTHDEQKRPQTTKRAIGWGGSKVEITWENNHTLT